MATSGGTGATSDFLPSSSMEMPSCSRRETVFGVAPIKANSSTMMHTVATPRIGRISMIGSIPSTAFRPRSVSSTRTPAMPV